MGYTLTESEAERDDSDYRWAKMLADKAKEAERIRWLSEDES